MDQDSNDPDAFAESPPRKRQKRELPTKLIYGAYRRSMNSSTPEPLSPAEKTKESAFVFESLPDCGPSSEKYASDITNYIPIGILRIFNENLQAPEHLWAAHDFWSAFRLPSDIFNNRDGPFVSAHLQDILFKSLILSSYEMLFNYGCIRMEFKVNNDKMGQIRVYLLDNHLVNRYAIKSQTQIQRATMQLMREVDISKDAWVGEWSSDTPVLHIHPSLNPPDSTKDETVLEIFNSLPSPDPRTEDVSDTYARAAMTDLLENNVIGLTTDLYPYQCQSAALMLQKEVSPGYKVDARLIKLVDQKGMVWYCDPEEGFANREPRFYEGLRGGILAENMGLGKTLICLALILATRDVCSSIPPDYSVGVLPIRKTTGSLVEMAASAVGRHSVPWKIAFALNEAEGLEFLKTRQALESHPGHYVIPPKTPLKRTRAVLSNSQRMFLSTATIVVVPPNLIQQWRGEIIRHTTGLKVLAMAHSQSVLPPAEELLQYDIILFTRARFDSELRSPEGTPLARVHFKRIIYDEGHTIGNSSASSQTETYTLLRLLKITSRWAVSGTPTQGLYSTDDSNGDFSASLDVGKNINKPSNGVDHQIADNQKLKSLAHSRERIDLVKLGNIAIFFLQMQPWTPPPGIQNTAYWNQYVLQPRHGAKSHGTPECLRSTLESLIIKHKLSDIEADVVLPPLHQSVVKLEPCLQNKLTLNLFNFNIITNAITSERKDVDYFFHPKQRTHLQSLVTNMREASFFWSGFEVEHLQSTIANAEMYLVKENKVASDEDIALLKQAVEMGRSIVSNNIFRQISRWHEMPLLIENDMPDSIRQALSLDTSIDNPTMVSASMLSRAQKFVYHRTGSRNVLDGLLAAARKSFKDAERALDSRRLQPRKTKSKGIFDTSAKRPTMVTAGIKTRKNTDGHHSHLLSHRDVAEQMKKTLNSRRLNPEPISPESDEVVPRDQGIRSPTNQHSTTSSSNVMGQNSDSSSLDLKKTDINQTLCSSRNFAASSSQSVKDSHDSEQVNPDFSLNTARIISTASTKLTYLLDRISVYQETEKILVFYESSNVAYYIAECLECMNINHLIYAKELKSEKRAEYVVTFNSSPAVRVLLMDVSQAAYGLDISSASRVFFINPVFSRQVEVQAVKRAHRIGQRKPVYVETLVLTGSIEEAIVDRREVVSNEQHQKYKSILDDRTLYDWILNAKLIPMDIVDVPGPEQMAAMGYPQTVFGHGAGVNFEEDTHVIETEAETEAEAEVESIETDLEKEDLALISAWTVYRQGISNPLGARALCVFLDQQEFNDEDENRLPRQDTAELRAMQRRVFRELEHPPTATTHLTDAFQDVLENAMSQTFARHGDATGSLGPATHGTDLVHRLRHHHDTSSNLSNNFPFDDEILRRLNKIVDKDQATREAERLAALEAGMDDDSDMEISDDILNVLPPLAFL